MSAPPDPAAEAPQTRLTRRALLERALAAGAVALQGGRLTAGAMPFGAMPGGALLGAPPWPGSHSVGPHFAPRAKRVIFLFMFGGPSQMDLFDHKPELQQRHGQTVELEFRKRQTRPGVILGSQRKFARHGETGQWCSDAFQHLPRHIDKLAIVKSLYTDSFAHGSAVLQMNSGQVFQGHPALGSWINFGLGSENPQLPGFVVMYDPRGGPISGASNWSSGYMPAAYQGTLFRASGTPLLNLVPEPTPSGRFLFDRAQMERQVALLRALGEEHRATRPHDTELEARIANAELAHEMQQSAREALDLSQEDPRTLAMYALDQPRGEHRFSLGPAPFGRQCLIARRLVERGVRFVQLYHGGGHQQQTWDAHHGVEENLGIHCPEVDQPIAALLTDLERSGLLDETLVVWGGEFGRQPISQEANPEGRDHNPKAFTMWLAGAGIRPGSYGATDELGDAAVEDRHHLRDLHATILHLMGLDHERLIYPYGGLDRKLTGVLDASPIRAILS